MNEGGDRRTLQGRDVAWELIKAWGMEEEDPFVDVSGLEDWNAGFRSAGVVDDITGGEGCPYEEEGLSSEFGLVF